VQRIFRAFVTYIQMVGILTLDIRQPELLRNTAGRVIVANHPTLLDVVLLVAQFPQADCVVKREAWSNPYLRGVVKAAGYIPNDEGQALVDACVRRIAQGRSILLFPEGTRSPRHGLGRFQRGAAHIALAAGCDILPVRIRCEPPTLMRGQKWYEVPDRAMTYTLEPGAALAGLPYQRAVDAGEPRGRVARRMTAALREFF
jgi:1-acyl-sn-glycerol-3-phosphate acyltransferase